MRLTELADLLGLDIKITRHANRKGEYSADFAGMVELKDNKSSCILGSCTGHGATITEALHAMKTRIEHKWLVIDAADKEKRREFGVPDLHAI